MTLWSSVDDGKELNISIVQQDYLIFGVLFSRERERKNERDITT